MRKRRCLSILLVLALLAALLPALQVSAGYETGYRPEPGDGGIVAHGVDLSAWQGHEVDFNKIKEQGYSFVILRAGYATTIDSTFEENYARAKDAGLDVGVYLYSYADNVQEALEEAEACKTWLRDKLLEYPVYYDLEEPEKHYNMSVSELTTLALAFMDEMAADGWLTGLYSCRSWYDSKYDLDRIMGTYECWIAQYYASGTYESYEQYTENYGMWQYSASGAVDGVPGNVDMNVCFRDYPSICRQYGFNGYPATGETLWLQGAAAPEVLVTGQKLELSGRVVSTNGALSSVTAGIYDSEGVLITSVSGTPGKDRFELSSLGQRLGADRLADGSYLLRITARNAEETRVLLEQSLVLSPSGARLDGANQPVNLKEGERLDLTGTVTASTKIRSLLVGIYDRYGKTIMAQTVNPETSSYDISALSGQINFGTLTMGSYQYCIKVTTEAGSETLLNRAFNVWVRSDPITLSEVSLKESYLPGELQGLGGTVKSSSSNLRQVSVTVYDYVGATAAEAKVSVTARSVRFDILDQMMDLSALEAGTYQMVITALNDAGPQTLLTKSFRITPDAISLCALEVPSMLCVGDSFNLGGMVASDQTALSSVSVTVADSSGVNVLSAAALPGGNTFDLAAFNSRLLFSTLSEGEYTLRITAENGTAYRVLYEAPLYVTAHSDLLSWESDCYRPGGRVYSSGSVPLIWGNLISAQSDLSEISVEICSQSGRLLTKATREVSGTYAMLFGLNEGLRLSALADGTYLYRVTATNASGTYILVQDRFTLARCPHASVQSGVQYAATCTSPGVICDSHCLDCGAKVGAGFVLPSAAHSYAEGLCTGCGAKEPKILTLQETDTVPPADAWLVLGVCIEDVLYALDENGALVQLQVSPEGEIQVPRTLTWRLREKSSGSTTGYALVNAAGRMLHLDTDGVKIAYGAGNAILQPEATEAGFVLRFAHSPETPLELGGTTEFRIFARPSANS